MEVSYECSNKGIAMKMNVPKFDRIAREIFAPAYVAIAEQIKEKTGITKGICLDVGAGGGYLGIALAKITDLDVFLLDRSQEMLNIAGHNIIAGGLEARVDILSGDVHKIPINDESIDLVISRGSVFFWKNKLKAFNEIYRVLVPRGRAYIGGGFGTPETEKQIRAKMNKIDKNWPGRKGKNVDNQRICSKALSKSSITDWAVNKSKAGLWIEIWK
jgi:ubiquinone/menaquinone biosynthesis C-methylase UbiE